MREKLPGLLARRLALRGRRPWVLVAAVYADLVLGLGLVFQSSRWSATPAYGNLLAVYDAPTWGFVHLGIALFMAVAIAIPQPTMILAAHTVGAMLALAWEAAFLDRYATNKSTTVVTWLFESLILLIIGYSLIRTLKHRGPISPPIA